MVVIVGGVGGVALSFWISDTLVAILNAGRPATDAVHVTADAHVLVFSILVTCATAILCGLLPAWQATRPDLLSALKREPAASRAGNQAVWSRSLVVVQIAVCLVILFSAGLLTQTLRTLTTVDLGFEPEKVIALKLKLTTMSPRVRRWFASRCRASPEHATPERAMQRAMCSSSSMRT